MSFEMGNDQPLAVNNFSGGITDNYIDCELNKYQELDNFSLAKHGSLAKPVQRPGSIAYLTTAVQLPSGDNRVGFMHMFGGKLLARSGRHLYVEDGSSWLEAYEAHPLAPASIFPTNNMYFEEWNGHLMICSDSYTKPVKIYYNEYGLLKLRTAGLPVPQSFIVTGAGGHHHIYKIIYKYSYKVGNLTYIDRGTPVSFTLNTSSATAPSNTVTFGSALVNNSETNYDTSNVKIEIYRTIDNGTVFYLVAEVANGTTTYLDTMSDATLQTKTLLYVEDGNFENDEPPLCKCIHIVDNVCLYANIKEGTEYNGGLIRQSKIGDIDSVPFEFETLVADSIIGLSSYKSNPIVFCERFTYRLEGLYDNYGRNGTNAIKISDRAGCISTHSIVQTNDGVFWAGIDGFYYTNGYTVRNICLEFTERYLSFTRLGSEKIQGKVDSVNNRVYWTVMSDGASDCDKVYILDLTWSNPQSDQWCFYTWSGNSFSPTAITTYKGSFYRGTKNGYIFKHDPIYTSDPKVNTILPYADWHTEAIIYNYRGFETSFGTQYSRKFTTRFVLTAKMTTNLSLMMESNSDDNRVVIDLKPLRSRGAMVWGDPDVYWGDDYTWNKAGLLQIQRRYPAKALKCMTKSMHLTNAHVAIVNSNLIGTATTDGFYKTVILDDLTRTFPNGAEDYHIAFENDDYTREFLITERVSNTQLVVYDVAGLLPTNSGLKFQIRGYPKNEVFYLLEYAIDWMHLGRTQDIYTKAQNGDLKE